LETESGSVAAAAATADSTAAEAALAAEVGVLSHGFVDGITGISHHRFGETPALELLDPAEFLRTTAKRQDNDEGEDGFHGREF
jgi:hypothetical protein